MNRPFASVTTFGAKQVIEIPLLLVEEDAPAPVEVLIRGGLALLVEKQAGGRRRRGDRDETSGSSAPTSTIAPSLPSGLLAQIDQRVKISFGMEPPLGVGRHGEGNAVHVGGGDLDPRPGDPLVARSPRGPRGP